MIVMKVKLNKELVEIHAHICGDGNIYQKLEERSPSSRRTGRSIKPFYRYIIEYTNTCSRLLDRMTERVKTLHPQAYIYRSNKRQKIQIRNKELFRIMIELGAGNSFDWDIPSEIIFNSAFRRIWLASFFDDEGCISASGIFFYSSNLKAIIKVKLMLEMDGILCTLTKRRCKNSPNPAYTIRVRNKSHLVFNELISYCHPDKILAYKKHWNKN